MNNKGQTLIVFVILIPILLLILTFVVDYGLLSIEKRKVSNTTYDAIEYYLDNLNQENISDKTKKLLQKNLKNIDINIVENEDYVEVEVKDNYKSFYNKLINSEIIIKYKGLKKSKEIIKG